MPPVGFEPTISAGERPQSHVYTARLLGPAKTKCYIEFIKITIYSSKNITLFFSPHYKFDYL